MQFYHSILAGRDKIYAEHIKARSWAGPILHTFNHYDTEQAKSEILHAMTQIF